MPTDTIAFIAVLSGWPAVVLSLGLTLTGIAAGRRRTVITGALVAGPFLLYLFGSPRIGWLSLVVGALYLGSAQAVVSSKAVAERPLAPPKMRRVRKT